jgi:hypothetical protein
MTTNTNKIPSLGICLLLDVVGIASYFVPIWGEWIDVIWAPLSAFLFYWLFGGKTGTIGSAITLAEEALPFTDLIPMFTIGYLVRRFETKDRYKNRVTM